MNAVLGAHPYAGVVILIVLFLVFVSPFMFGRGRGR